MNLSLGNSMQTCLPTPKPNKGPDSIAYIRGKPKTQPPETLAFLPQQATPPFEHGMEGKSKASLVPGVATAKRVAAAVSSFATADVTGSSGSAWMAKPKQHGANLWRPGRWITIQAFDSGQIRHRYNIARWWWYVLIYSNFNDGGADHLSQVATSTSRLFITCLSISPHTTVHHLGPDTAMVQHH